MSSFTPKFETLPASQREVWKELGASPPRFVLYGGTALALRLGHSLLDLAGTKLKVLLQRIEAKDYLDVAAILRAGIPIADMLRSARTLFGDSFNPLAAQKTLGWFEGADLSEVDARTRSLLTAASLEDVKLPPMRKVADRVD